MQGQHVPNYLSDDADVWARDPHAANRKWFANANYGLFLRFRRHAFDPVMASRLRLVVHATWGSPYAEVFDFRAYG